MKSPPTVWVVEIRRRRQGTLKWTAWEFHHSCAVHSVAKRSVQVISGPLGNSEFQARAVPYDRRKR